MERYLNFKQNHDAIRSLNNKLENAAIKSYQYQSSNLTLKLIREEEEKWFNSKLEITNISKVYFRYSINGVRREGRDYLAKLKIGEGLNEYICEISYLDHSLIEENNLQIVLYSGKVLYLVGEDLTVILNDTSPTETIEVPDDIATSNIVIKRELTIQSRVSPIPSLVDQVQINERGEENNKDDLQILSIKGIGKILEDKLNKLEIDTIDKLAKSDPYYISQELNIPHPTIIDWIKEAQTKLAHHD